MIRTIHSIKNIFHNNAAASSFSHLYIHEGTIESKNEDYSQATPNLFVAVSKASTCHIFFYHIDDNETESKKSKLMGVWSNLISSEEVLTIRLISNGIDTILMALTQYGKLLISDPLSPNVDICIHQMDSTNKASFLGMNMMESKQTNEYQDRLTFVIGGSISISPPAIAFSNNCFFKDYNSLRDLTIETKEIYGVEAVTAKLTAMSYFDLSILKLDLRNHLIRLWKKNNSGDDFPSMDSIGSAVLLGYSDGSVYLSFVESTAGRSSINTTHATKILHMDMPKQRIVSICLTPNDRTLSDGIIFIGHLYGIAFIHVHNQDPNFVQHKSSSYFGAVNHAQVVSSFPTDNDSQNLVASNTKDTAHIIVSTNSGKAVSATLPLCTNSRHKSIEFQETTLRKDCDWIGLHRTRKNGIMIFLTVTGSLKIVLANSLLEAALNTASPTLSTPGGISAKVDIPNMLDMLKKLPKTMDNSPKDVNTAVFEKLRKATEMISNDSGTKSNDEHVDERFNYGMNAIHFFQSPSNHFLKSANLNDLVIKGHREDVPVIYGGYSQSFFPVDHTDVHNKKGYRQVVWNGFDQNTFDSSCIIFNDKGYSDIISNGRLNDGAYSSKAIGLAISKNEKKRSALLMEDGANAVVHVKDRNKQARHVAIQNIVLKFLAENDATLLRNSFLHSCTIHGLECTISSLCHQQEKLTAYLHIEGKNRDVSIAISLLESAAKSTLSTSMRNCNGAFLNEIRHMHDFLSDDVGNKSVIYLYNRCRQLDVTEPQKKTVTDLHNKIRSLPLTCKSIISKGKISK
jgi:hypothetical protein